MAENGQNPGVEAGIGVARTALRVGQDRARRLRDMRSAFERGDERQALSLARELCGLPGGEHVDAHPGC
ncbi:hypothetical protein [Desulfovibrio aminophilus]|uniref:hypothetical protein n=1 Tax=Desulfovibrio aminophilus TaxID=81425 RepID=UPI000421DDF9|nr:hypothetical protein [Desulfovibrio aminophilus]